MAPHCSRFFFRSTIVVLCAVAASNCGGGSGDVGGSEDSPQPRPAVVVNSAELSWMPPLANTNGTALTDLAGYDIQYGRTATDLNQIITITNPSINRYLVEDLAEGTWYFAVAAINSRGAKSELSNIESKTI
jgi:hypothetical protein